MDINTRLARFDAGLLRVKGRISRSKQDRAPATEVQELLADLDVLLTAHLAELAPDERRHLQRIRRAMTREIPGYAPREPIRRKLRRMWRRIEPKLRRAVTVRSSG